MDEKNTVNARRVAVRNLLLPFAASSAWCAPVIQSFLLPVHAQTSPCDREDILGSWQLEILGPASSTSEISFFADGSADHSFIDVWQFTNGEIRMAQGTTWNFTGVFDSCDTLFGNYVNVFTVPVLGNTVVRRGDWRASKLV